MSIAAVGVATTSLELAKVILKAAIASGNPWAIVGAAALVGASAAGVALAAALVVTNRNRLEECEKQHSVASGSCDSSSGSCDSG